MAIYMLYAGIGGNVTAQDYEGQIELLSVSQSVDRAVSMVTGNLANRENRSPQLSTINATLKFSKHSTAMFTEATSGDQGKDVTITFTQTSADQQVPYLVVSLKGAMISHYSISGDGVDEPIENICLSFKAIEMKYSDHSSDNKLGGQQVAAYSVEKGNKTFG